MAKEENEFELGATLFTMGLALGVAGYFAGIISSWPMFFLVFLSFAALGVFLEYKKSEIARQERQRQRKEERQQEEREWDSIRSSIVAHIDTLARKKRTLVRKGDYGEVVDDAWRKEITRFLTVRLHPLTYTRLGGDRQSAGFRLETLVDGMVSEHIEIVGSSFSDLDVSSMDGVEYEAFCGEILEREGWQVKRTPATGDHGVDLIAEKPGRRVAIQCKKYSTPVGNKAVQEAYSGMMFFDAKEAVVVTNSTFTQAAQILANKLSVALKHHEELRTL